LAIFKLPSGASRDARLLISTRALRGFADGAISVILPSYLAALGFSAFQIAVLIFAMLFGSALLTLWIGLAGARFDLRRALLSATLLMFATGVAFYAFRSFWPLFIIALIGTLNPSAGDVSLFLPVEQTALAATAPTKELTSMFALYNVAGAIAGALGALASGLPALAANHLHRGLPQFERLAFLGYSAVAISAAILYFRMRPQTASRPSSSRRSALPSSRAIVIRLAALFSLDAFGGGFVVQSLLALWLFQRFAMRISTAGAFFFAAGLLGALSQLLSPRIAARIGRIRTMAYTHIPANTFLVLAALMPGPKSAIAFLLLRSSMSSMDVPARQAYVMAMVPPEERAAAASITNVPRSLASAFAPLPSGALLEISNFGWPLICAGALKLLYDVLLLRQFAAVMPEDERD